MRFKRIGKKHCKHVCAVSFHLSGYALLRVEQMQDALQVNWKKTLQACMRGIVSSVGLRLTHANIAITRIRRAMPDAMFICYVGNIIKPCPT